MKNFSLLEFRRLIRKENIILSFEGKLSQEVLKNLVDTLQEKLSEENDRFSDENTRQYVSKKVFSIFIELAQNIQHHSSEVQENDDDSAGSGVIIIRDMGKFYIISSGNLCDKTKAIKLKNYCQHINQLNSTGLKELYKEKLRTQRKEGQKGGGIGLLYIAKKSNIQIDFEMEPIDEMVFLVLSAKINKDE